MRHAKVLCIWQALGASGGCRETGMKSWDMEDRASSKNTGTWPSFPTRGQEKGNRDTDWAMSEARLLGQGNSESAGSAHWEQLPCPPLPAGVPFQLHHILFLPHLSFKLSGCSFILLWSLVSLLISPSSLLFLPLVSQNVCDILVLFRSTKEVKLNISDFKNTYALVPPPLPYFWSDFSFFFLQIISSTVEKKNPFFWFSKYIVFVS